MSTHCSFDQISSQKALFKTCFSISALASALTKVCSCLQNSFHLGTVLKSEEQNVWGNNIYFVHKCMCGVHLWFWACIHAGAHRGQKRAPGCLDLESQVVASCPLWVLGTETLVFCKTLRALSLRAIFPAWAKISWHGFNKPCFQEGATLINKDDK